MRLRVAALLAFVAFVVASLAYGAPYLEARLPGGLPLGNLLTGLGLCALASPAVLLSARGTTLRAASLAALVGAALWLPASIALAGNAALNFSSDRGAVWLALSAAVLVGAIGTLLWAWAARAR